MIGKLWQGYGYWSSWYICYTFLKGIVRRQAIGRIIRSIVKGCPLVSRLLLTSTQTTFKLFIFCSSLNTYIHNHSKKCRSSFKLWQGYGYWSSWYMLCLFKRDCEKTCNWGENGRIIRSSNKGYPYPLVSMPIFIKQYTNYI